MFRAKKSFLNAASASQPHLSPHPDAIIPLRVVGLGEAESEDPGQRLGWGEGAAGPGGPKAGRRAEWLGGGAGFQVIATAW